MLNYVVEQLLLFLGVIWYCDCVRKCPYNGKMHNYAFKGEASYLHPVFRFSKSKMRWRGLSSLYYPFDFFVGLKFFNNNNNNNKPMKVYQEL